MSDTEKASRILSVLVRISSRVVLLKPEDVLAKCTPAELDFYYCKLCEEDHK